MVNKFSKESTRENMLKAKENLLIYLDSILCEEYEESSQFIQRELERFLRNFYFFLEAFREAKPDKRASLITENLQKIQIENEYDLAFDLCGYKAIMSRRQKRGKKRCDFHTLIIYKSINVCDIL